MAQRYAAQGWLDWAKMEEERGKLQRSGMILRYGLEFCEFSEPLLTRAIKHEERRGASEDTHCSFSAVSRQLLANCLRKCGGGTAEKHHMAAGSYVRNQVQSKEGRSGDHNITATGPKVCQVTSANSPCTSALHKHSTGCVMGSDERDNPGEVQQTEQRDTGIISLSSYCEVSGGGGPSSLPSSGARTLPNLIDQAGAMRREIDHQAAIRKLAYASEESKGLSGARALLARLKHASIDKVWRTVLEGALLEARSGEVSIARKVLKYLMTHVPW